MRRVTRNGVIAVAAASGAMAVAMPAYADSGAEGVAAGSPGVASGNSVQLPVHVPVNVCGNTVNVVGLLNPAAGNTCVNEDVRHEAASGSSKGASGTSGASAEGDAHGSPGLLSGNGVQLPVHVPVNVTGNSVNVVGIGNPSTDNSSVNDSGERPEPAPERTVPARTLPAPVEQEAAPAEQVALAETGADHTVPVLATGAAMFLGGVALYRRARLRAGV
ncbi:chaplin [Streptomyces griseoincarnatus]|uniref:chaplin n=1 Tax=Streptomyces TaxID=1883 RepID=UPI000653B8B5|nr:MULTISPECIES: chaplin [unclassified Streptomyces]MBU5943572.1 chaplin [Streptomyces sp. PAM3C]WPW17755.1 chaplin [Streptomyces griseoincarnatus]